MPLTAVADLDGLDSGVETDNHARGWICGHGAAMSWRADQRGEPGRETEQQDSEQSDHVFFSRFFLEGRSASSISSLSRAISLATTWSSLHAASPSRTLSWNALGT